MFLSSRTKQTKTNEIYSVLPLLCCHNKDDNGSKIYIQTYLVYLVYPYIYLSYPCWILI